MKLTCLPLLGLLILAPPGPRAQTNKSPSMLEAMKTEMVRSMEQLKKQPAPPYFLSYEVTQTETAGTTGSFGALVSSYPGSRRRMLGIDLRVGSEALDNTHPIRGAFPNFRDTMSFFPMPIDDDPRKPLKRSGTPKSLVPSPCKIRLAGLAARRTAQ